MALSPYVATTAAVAATAVAGSIASTDVNSAWYAGLDKPSIQPPGVVFGPVWSTLYTDIAVTSGMAIKELGAIDPEAAKKYQQALAINLVLNASWSWVFFRAHKLLPAVLVAGALATSSIDLVRRTFAVRHPAGIALAPYAAWCSFATILSTAIWVRNRK